MIPEAAVAFVVDLLRTPVGSADHTIGADLWKVLGDGTRDEVLVLLTEFMRGAAPQSRAFEVAYDVWLQLGGAGVAA